MHNKVSKEEEISQEITSTFKVVFGTEHGSKCLKRLKEVFIDRPIYTKGQTLEDTSYRQGQADLIRQILREVER